MKPARFSISPDPRPPSDPKSQIGQVLKSRSQIRTKNSPPRLDPQSASLLSSARQRQPQADQEHGQPEGQHEVMVDPATHGRNGRRSWCVGPHVRLMDLVRPRR